jgi:hypothetical protein
MKYGLYFTILTVLWFAIWACGVWYFETRRLRGPLFRRLSVKRRLLMIAALVGLPCIYCLSYPPLRPTLGTLDDLYVPVQWGFDNTALQAPLLRWADFCGASPNQMLAESASRKRSMFWGTTPAYLYASGWIIFGIICCILPAYLIYRLSHWWRAGMGKVSIAHQP